MGQTCPDEKKRVPPLASRDPPFLLGCDAVEDRDRDLGGRKIQTLRYSSGYATKEGHCMTSNCTSKWSFCRGCWSALQLKAGSRNGWNRSGEPTRWKCWLIIVGGSRGVGGTRYLQSSPFRPLINHAGSFLVYRPILLEKKSPHQTFFKSSYQKNAQEGGPWTEKCRWLTPRTSAASACPGGGGKGWGCPRSVERP